MTQARVAAKFVPVVVLTAALSWVGLYTGRGAGHVPAIWWANSALVAVMLLSPRRQWPWLLAAGYAGNLIGHLLLHDPVSQTVLLSACDIGETAIAAFSVGFALGERVDLTQQRQLLQFVGFAAVLGPLVASLAAGVVLHLLVDSTFTLSLRWFPPSALGMCIVVPLVLGLARSETKELFYSTRLANTLLYLLMIAATTAAIFSRAEFPLLFLLFPPLLFLVTRLGLSGGALGCCAIAAIGTAFTIGSHGGPLAALDPRLEQRILMLQMFLATTVLSVSVIGVVLAELQRVSRAMEALAAADALTGVANRRRFDEAFRREWKRLIRTPGPMSLLMLDIDSFKSYNDLYGHLEGDRCLRFISQAASEVARRPGDIVVRFGGDEFSVLLPSTDALGAEMMAQRLRRMVGDRHIEHSGNPHRIVTISVGCATVVPTAAIEAEELLAAADNALYQAKRNGRDCVHTVVLDPLPSRPRPMPVGAR